MGTGGPLAPLSVPVLATPAHSGELGGWHGLVRTQLLADPRTQFSATEKQQLIVMIMTLKLNKETKNISWYTIFFAFFICFQLK